jgi:hypothetical protein
MADADAHRRLAVEMGEIYESRKSARAYYRVSVNGCTSSIFSKAGLRSPPDLTVVVGEESWNPRV